MPYKKTFKIEKDPGFLAFKTEMAEIMAEQTLKQKKQERELYHQKPLEDMTQAEWGQEQEKYTANIWASIPLWESEKDSDDDFYKMYQTNIRPSQMLGNVRPPEINTAMDFGKAMEQYLEKQEQERTTLEKQNQEKITLETLRQEEEKRRLAEEFREIEREQEKQRQRKAEQEKEEEEKRQRQQKAERQAERRKQTFVDRSVLETTADFQLLTTEQRNALSKPREMRMTRKKRHGTKMFSSSVQWQKKCFC